MTFANPWLLLGLGLLLPALVAFLMKRRRTVLRVPSTLLWQAASLRRIRNRKLRHVTRLLALLALLAGLAAIALGAASPRASEPAETVAVVVDLSASMGRGEESPLDQARREIERLLDSRDASESWILIGAGARPLRLAGPTSSSAALEGAVEQLAPERGGADLSSAIDLAVGLLRRSPSPRIVVFHDGGEPLGAPPRPLEGPSAPEVQMRLLRPEGEDSEDDENGQQEHNLGVVTFASRRPTDAETDDERELLVVVATSSAVPRGASLSIEAFGATLAERQIEVPARGERELRLRVRTPAERVSVSLRPTDGHPDVLDADDQVDLVQGAVIPPRVLLVAPADAPMGETFFLTEALRATGVREIQRVAPADAATALRPHDVVVVLSSPPSRRLGAPTLFLGTEGDGAAVPFASQRELVADSEAGTPTRLHSIAESHALLAGVDLEGLTIRRALAADTPADGRALVELEGGPVVLVGGDGAEGWVYVGLEPRGSAIVLRVAFPVLVANALARLGGATQLSVADTVPRREVTLRRGPRLAATPIGPPSRSLPRNPSVWLALLGITLLSAEAFAWRKGWTR